MATKELSRTWKPKQRSCLSTCCWRFIQPCWCNISIPPLLLQRKCVKYMLDTVLLAASGEHWRRDDDATSPPPPLPQNSFVSKKSKFKLNLHKLCSKWRHLSRGATSRFLRLFKSWKRAYGLGKGKGRVGMCQWVYFYVQHVIFREIQELCPKFLMYVVMTMIAMWLPYAFADDQC